MKWDPGSLKETMGARGGVGSPILRPKVVRGG